jgi:hypothetical protein
VLRDGEEVWKLGCPGCGHWAEIDDDQLHGRVSVDHAGEGGCTFHETRDWFHTAKPKNERARQLMEGDSQT